MAYAAPNDVRAVLAPDPLTGTPAELGDSDLNGHIDAASAQVEAALSQRYAVPFTPTPPLIKAITVAIAAWLATLTYRRTVDLESQEPTVLRYVWATGLLTALASGASDLPGASGNPPPPGPSGGGAAVVNRYCGRLFTEEDFDLTRRQRGPILNPYSGW